MLSNIGWMSLTFVKIDESWKNYFVEFNESSPYSMNFFLVQNFRFLQNFVSYHLVNGQTLMLHTNIADT